MDPPLTENACIREPANNMLVFIAYTSSYSAFNVYRRELAPGTVSLTGDRAQGDDSKHWANSKALSHARIQRGGQGVRPLP